MCSRYGAIQRSIATNVPDVPAKHYLPYTRHTLAPSLSTPCRRKKTKISIAWPYARVNQSHKIPDTAKSTGTRKTLVATPHGLDRAINTQTHSAKQLHHQQVPSGACSPAKRRSHFVHIQHVTMPIQHLPPPPLTNRIPMRMAIQAPQTFTTDKTHWSPRHTCVTAPAVKHP